MLSSVLLPLVVGVLTTSACPPPPIATLFLLDADVEPIGDVGVTKLAFNMSKSSPKPSFLLHCEHDAPIRWVLDEDLTLGEISQPAPSPTLRMIRSFHDPSTYKYFAHYYVEMQHPSRDHIFICQPFQNSANTNSSCDPNPSRAVVLAEVQYTLLASRTKLLRVEVISPKELVSTVVPPLAEFDAKIKAHHEPEGGTNKTSCPFILNLALSETSKALYIEWVAVNSSGSSGLENVHMIASVQSLQNVNRFYSQMEEDCVSLVDVGNIKNKNKFLSYQAHKFYPHVLTYALGDERRMLKIFFDLAQDINFYYSWETPDPRDMVYGAVEEKVIYKGQTFTVKCTPSVYLFSQGVQIAWSFQHVGSGFISPSDFLEKEDFSVESGNYKARGRVSFERDFLVDNDLHSVQISCVCPLWNQNGWINHTFSVTLRDSQPPYFIFSSDDDEDKNPLDNSTTNDNFTSVTIYELEFGAQENFTISCEAGGVPLPTVEFIPPKKNLDTELATRLAQNGTAVLASLHFPENMTSDYAGDYVCVAKSVVGEARRLFKVRIRQAFLPKFVIIILIAGGVVLLVFALISTALLLKLKKEKVEFMRATEEAIKKFREGFQTTGDLGFKSNSEYKNYEIPLTRWGLGNTLLGSGAFGVVQKGVIYYGENRQDVVAVKTVNSPKDVNDFENSLMELTIMSYIGKHEHIVSLLGACTDNLTKRSILIGVEFCANGDLLNYLQKRRALFRSFVSGDGLLSLDSISGRSSYANVANSGNFTSLDLYKWAFQVANGMAFLVSKKILHADLAARNVLLTQDNICKISDFGLSRHLLMSDNYTKKTNSPLPWRWMGIESLKYRQFSSASDVWSYGVTLYEIFALGEEPWPGMAWTNEFMEELERGRRLAKPKFSTNNMYNQVMLECWRTEPSDRITFAQAKEFFETAISNLTSPEGKGDEMLNSVC